MDPERRRAAALAFVDPAQLDGPEMTVQDVDRHHLERVLRLRPGEAVIASDGAGRWRSCRWALAGRLDADGPVMVEPAPVPPVVVGFAVLKGDRTEWVVQKLTELGVDRLLPFVAERNVVRWEPGSERALRQAEKWRQVAREAAMQSRRARLPEVAEVQELAQVAAEYASPRGSVASMAEPGGPPPSLDRPVVLVGPEGGWSDAELSLGLPTVGLGSGVLRGETAALAAAVLLCGLRSQIIRHQPGNLQ
ncbi:MAG TPA: RsmE family RNA methyltransferase [Acidimicrobiales bacterium]|nr:RsmE family RNA methyltransferase [Acidimicrobiales bacterium]